VTNVKRLLERVLLCGAFASFWLLLVFSNDFDWDFMFTTFEVDRRSWLVDAAPPLWSYQFCAGVTRAGDPQAFGLSPLFLVVALFGSYWGVKATIGLLSIAGFWFLRAILTLILEGGGASPPRTSPCSPDERGLVNLLSAGFVFGNYFLWHFHHGHVPFALTYCALGILWLLLKALAGSWRSRDGVLTAVLCWSYFSAGFYHSAMFFLLPLALALAAFGLLTGAQMVFRSHADRARVAVVLRGVWSFGVSAFVGLVAASYKVAQVLAYQARSPRIPEARISEPQILDRLLTFQLAPTLDYRLVGAAPHRGPYGLWEYSAFNMNAWLLVAFALYYPMIALGQRRSGRAPDARRTFTPLQQALVAFLLVYGLVLVLLLLGDSSGSSLHRFLNARVGDSIRVVGRYQIGVAFLLTVALALILSRHRAFAALVTRYLTIPALVIIAANPASFRATLASDEFQRLLGLPRIEAARMDTMALVSSTPVTTLMYAPTLRGVGVLNCYNPLRREAEVADRLSARLSLTSGVVELPLVDPMMGSPSRACIERSHFTQNDLVVAPDCTAGVCVNVNALNPSAPSALRFDRDIGKYCLPTSDARVSSPGAMATTVGGTRRDPRPSS